MKTDGEVSRTEFRFRVKSQLRVVSSSAWINPGIQCPQGRSDSRLIWDDRCLSPLVSVGVPDVLLCGDTDRGYCVGLRDCAVG